MCTLLCLASVTQHMFLRFTHVVVSNSIICSFLSLHIFHCIIIPQFIHSTTDGHSGCFFLSFMNKAAVNILA